MAFVLGRFAISFLGWIPILPMCILSVAGADKPEASLSDDDLRIRGVFDSNLPSTEKKHSLKIILHPHFGDLHRHDYLRIPIGVRYGLSDDLEVSAEIESYMPHGLGGDTGDAGFGFSGYRFGSKLNRGLFANFNWDQVIGFDATVPTKEAPADITDGFRHFRPYMNFARRLSDSTDSRIFWGVGLDLVQDTGIEGTFSDNAIRDNSNTFTIGRVWEGKRMTYTFESTYATSRLLGKLDQDTFTVRPGIIWRVPRSYTFNSRGNWVIGGAVRAGYGPDGLDLGLSVKVKINLRFKD